MYIAVDEDGLICLFEKKPKRVTTMHETGIWDTKPGVNYKELPKWVNDKLKLTWEDNPMKLKKER